MKKLPIVIACFFVLFISARANAQGWMWGTGSTNSGTALEFYNIAKDGSGNIYEVGYNSGGLSTFGSITLSNSGGAQGVLAGVDSNGNYRWALGTQGGSAFFYKVATDAYGNVYVLGSGNYGATNITFGSSTLPDTYYFCIKVDSTGNVIWFKPILPMMSGSVGTIAIGSSGDIYIAGNFNSPTLTIGSSVLTNTSSSGTSYDVFYAKYDSSLTPIWAKSFGGDSNEIATVITVYGDSVIYIGGTDNSHTIHIGSFTLAEAGTQPFYITKISGSGNPLWVRTVDGKESLYATMNDIVADYNGNVYMLGSYADTPFYFGPDVLPAVPCSNMFLAKYDSVGTPKWARTGPIFGRAFSAGIDRCGNLWTSGSYLSGCYLTDHLLLSEFDTSGVLEDTVRLAIGGDDESGLIVDNKGNILIGGDYTAHTVIAGHSLPASYGESYFFAKYKYDSGTCKHDTLIYIPLGQQLPDVKHGSISLYPNPALEQCTVKNSQPFSDGTFIEIFDVTGRLVKRIQLAGYETNIPLADLVGGLYLYQINDIERSYTNGKLVVIK